METVQWFNLERSHLELGISSYKVLLCGQCQKEPWAGGMKVPFLVGSSGVSNLEGIHGGIPVRFPSPKKGAEAQTQPHPDLVSSHLGEHPG